ncbi:CsgG/HfaB family protein [Campylobacter molothri]|uniref:CsgG/HfaB family protein n=1 Tax=Campylobacter molothri TaxID=1032242 RepID=UPI001EFB299C|nr:CsgG/HfaB family protein [Campylobacter sp. RM10537]MBZ7948960.1 hypothetical protein [Campylobacter sp. RM10534]ULO00426.1 hypothetical protein CMOL_1283 [Campylobacter sp. RM10537]
MRKFFVLIAFFSLLWAENQNIIKAQNEKNIIIYDYSPAQDVNFSNIQSLKILPHQRSKFQKIMQGIGTGQTREDALNNALIDVLSKLKGISKFNLRQEIKNIDFKFSALGEVIQDSKNILQNIINGRIDSYEVTSAENNGTSWEVKILAYKYLYQNDQKPKLILFDENYGKLGENLTQALNNIFSNDSYFTLLERKNDFKSEDKLIESAQGSSDERSKLGNVLGTDYILEYKILDVSKQNNYITYQDDKKLKINISFKLIFYPTREIVLSKTLSANFMLAHDIQKEQKYWENIALMMQKYIQNSLFNTNAFDENKQDKGKDSTYKLHESGGVDLGF